MDQSSESKLQKMSLTKDIKKRSTQMMLILEKMRSQKKKKMKNRFQRQQVQPNQVRLRQKPKLKLEKSRKL